MGNRIRELRRKRGITMKQLGSVVDLAESTISQYENGKRQPDNETLLKLSEYFSVTVGYLLGVEEANENAPAISGERTASDDEIKFALFGGDGDITDAMYDEVRQFAAFVKQREAGKKKE